MNTHIASDPGWGPALHLVLLDVEEVWKVAMMSPTGAADYERMAYIAREGRGVGVLIGSSSQNQRVDDVLPKSVASNFAARVSFRVDDFHTSTAILGQKGAEGLGEHEFIVKGPGEQTRGRTIPIDPDDLDRWCERILERRAVAARVLLDHRGEPLPSSLDVGPSHGLADIVSGAGAPAGSTFRFVPTEDGSKSKRAVVAPPTPADETVVIRRPVTVRETPAETPDETPPVVRNDDGETPAGTRGETPRPAGDRLIDWLAWLAHLDPAMRETPSWEWLAARLAQVAPERWPELEAQAVSAAVLAAGIDRRGRTPGKADDGWYGCRRDDLAERFPGHGERS